MVSSYAVRMQGIARKYCLASVCQPECLPGRSPTRVGTVKPENLTRMKQTIFILHSSFFLSVVAYYHAFKQIQRRTKLLEHS